MLASLILGVGSAAVTLGVVLLWVAWRAWDRIDRDRDSLTRLMVRAEAQLLTLEDKRSELAGFLVQIRKLSVLIDQQRSQFHAEVDFARPHPGREALDIPPFGPSAEPSPN